MEVCMVRSRNLSSLPRLAAVTAVPPAMTVHTCPLRRTQTAGACLCALPLCDQQQQQLGSAGIAAHRWPGARVSA